MRWRSKSSNLGCCGAAGVGTTVGASIRRILGGLNFRCHGMALETLRHALDLGRLGSVACGDLILVSPFIFPLYAGRYLFQRFACLKGFPSLLGLQRLPAKHHQLSFLQRCAASVAQRFFMGRVRLQGWAPPFGLRV